jgi:hypothetical protein
MSAARAARPRRPAGAAAATRPADARPGGAASEPRAVPLLAALACLAGWLLLAPPVPGDGDSAEITVALAQAGLAHPTGYPLYTLLGHAFATLLRALGASWPWAANAWSALGGALAVYLLQRLALALLPPNALPDRRVRALLALLPVGLVVLDPAWVHETTLAEVYSWHVAWMLGTALLFVRVLHALDADVAPRRLAGAAALWGLLCGVGAAHHATSLLVSAPLSIVLLSALAAARRLRPALVAIALPAACAPLLSYAFVGWRIAYPAEFQWPAVLPGLAGFVQHVTGSQYRMNLGSFAPTAEQQRLLARAVYPLLAPALACAAFGAWRAPRGAVRLARRALLGAALLGCAWTLSYGVPDPAAYFLGPLLLALALATATLGALAGATHGVRVAWRAAGVAAAAGCIVLAAPWLAEARALRAVHVEYEALVHRLWASIPPGPAIVFWSDDMYPRLQLYLLEGERPGTTVWNSTLIYSPGTRAAFARRYGFDPAEGIRFAPREVGAANREALRDEGARAVEARVNARTALPVIHFDPNPDQPTAIALPKPR